MIATTYKILERLWQTRSFFVFVLAPDDQRNAINERRTEAFVLNRLC